MATNLRKSTRISKNSHNNSNNNSTDLGISAQSRITEYVNVRKRATPGAVELLKKSAVLEVPSENESVTSTPVKIKRKQSKCDLGAVKKMGLLTPSASNESIGNELNLESDKSVNINVVDTLKETETEIVKPVVEMAVPAYKRFAHLVDGVRNQKVKLSDPEEEVENVSVENVREDFLWNDFKSVPWLPLNDKWSFYEKLIFNVDSLCVLAAGRSQPCVFHKIQKTLENVFGKQVPLEQMERLKTVWPEAYEYRESRVVMQGRRVDSVALSVPGIAGTDSSASLLNERKEKVRGRVQKYLINAHANEFQYPQTEIPKQWNEKFDQNQVKEITRTPLLQQSLGRPVEKVDNTPKFIKEIIMASSPMKGSANIELSPSITAESPAKPTMTLLERIRAKEQALQNKKCTGSFDDPDEKIKAILTQMDRFTQSVMFTFTSSKKTSLFLSDLTTKLVQSASVPLSAAEVLERLKMLEKCAPEWIKICEEDGPRYVKILDKTRSLNSLLESLHTKYKQ